MPDWESSHLTPFSHEYQIVGYCWLVPSHEIPSYHPTLSIKLQFLTREIPMTSTSPSVCPLCPGYIFNARAKIGDGGDWVPFIAPDDRQKFEQELQKVRDPPGPQGTQGR